MKIFVAGRVDLFDGDALASHRRLGAAYAEREGRVGGGGQLVNDASRLPQRMVRCIRA